MLNATLKERSEVSYLANHGCEGVNSIGAQFSVVDVFRVIEGVHNVVKCLKQSFSLI